MQAKESLTRPTRLIRIRELRIRRGDLPSLPRGRDPEIT
jgi:hypothetical protein